MESEMKYNKIYEEKDTLDSKTLKDGLRLKIIRRVTFAGLFAALTILATYIGFTVGPGYFNLGDGVILVCAYILGPAAFFPAAIGSAVADLLKGYMIYIPATFVIKGLMGLAAGYLMKNEKITAARKITAFAIAEIIMVAGYFGYESLPFMYGPAVAAEDLLLSNLPQAAVGILIGMILTSILSKQRTVIRGKLF